jgi:hypothetical protein
MWTIRSIAAGAVLAGGIVGRPESGADDVAFQLHAAKPARLLRPGDKSLENIIRTDERYGHDPLFHGPRGKVYWDHLENPRPIQNPNLWPDPQSTYFLGRFALPPGSNLTLRAKYPHARYFKFALYKFQNNTFTSINEALAGPEIEPDAGSVNPFRVGANRLAAHRNFTLRIVAENAPVNITARARNTLYAGGDGGETEAVIRIYLSDPGYDGAGWLPVAAPSHESGMPTYEATLADGTKLGAKEVADHLGRPFTATSAGMTTEQWEALVHARSNDPALDPATAPARNPPRWEKYWTLKFSVAGAFKTPEERAKIPHEGAMEGGGDPTTQYMVTYLSRRFGPVYVIRGKLPTFPDTHAGKGGNALAIMSDAQTQYWSIVSCEAPPSGQVLDGLTDMQVPLDSDRNYTIVVSRPEDRPNNAIVARGVAWMNWSARGEGLDDPRNRPDFGMLIMRFMANNPTWANSPDKVLAPGSESAVMGAYYPRGYYTTKAEFESGGPRAMNDNTARAVSDDATVKSYTFTGTRDLRFGEILVVKQGGVEVYNTTGLNDCPPGLWDALDLEQIKKQLGALAVRKNGPHFWMMDSQTVSLGAKATFGGLEARWAARLDAAVASSAAQGSVPYRVFTPKKTQRMVYSKGKPVYELIDPEGHIYVMQAHDERFPIEALPKLGEQLKKLPSGWQYRVRILADDLILDLGTEQTIYGVGDEFHQYYTRIPQGR